MIKKISLTLFLVAIVIFGYLFFTKKGDKVYVSPFPVPTLLPTPTNEINSVTSPDGKVDLTMKKTTDKDITTYTFTSSKGPFYTKTVINDEIMSIPLNTWSPDNKYFFIKDVSGNTKNYIVVSPTGEAQNLTEFFTKAYPDYILQDVTGWASPTLLIVNANTGKDDISVWFEVTTKTFTRLSDRFN